MTDLETVRSLSNINIEMPTDRLLKDLLNTFSVGLKDLKLVRTLTNAGGLATTFVG